MAVETVRYTEISRVGDLQNGEMKGFEAEGEKVLLAKVDNQFYAARNICPHMGATLSEGKLEGTILTCPRHFSKFDLKDGHVVRWTYYTGVRLLLNNIARPPRSLPVYPVRVEGDRVMVQIKK